MPATIDPLSKNPQYANTNSCNGSAKDPAQKRKPGTPKRITSDNYDADYTTGGESCDELEEDWDRYAHIYQMGHWHDNNLQSDFIGVDSPGCGFSRLVHTNINLLNKIRL